MWFASPSKSPPNFSTRRSRAARVSATIGSSFFMLWLHQFFRRAEHGWLVTLRTAYGLDRTEDYRIRDVSTVPSDQIIHAVNSCRCDVQGIGRSFRRQSCFTEQSCREITRSLRDL